MDKLNELSDFLGEKITQLEALKSKPEKKYQTIDDVISHYRKEYLDWREVYPDRDKSYTVSEILMLLKSLKKISVDIEEMTHIKCPNPKCKKKNLKFRLAHLPLPYETNCRCGQIFTIDDSLGNISNYYKDGILYTL